LWKSVEKPVSEAEPRVVDNLILFDQSIRHRLFLQERVIFISSCFKVIYLTSLSTVVRAIKKPKPGLDSKEFAKDDLMKIQRLALHSFPTTRPEANDISCFFLS